MSATEIMILILLIVLLAFTEVISDASRVKQTQYKLATEVLIQQELSNRTKETELNTLRALALGKGICPNY